MLWFFKIFTLVTLICSSWLMGYQYKESIDHPNSEGAQNGFKFVVALFVVTLVLFTSAWIFNQAWTYVVELPA